MAELIDRNALLKVLIHRVKGNEDNFIVLGTNNTLSLVEEWVRSIPAIDAVPVVHGRWIEHSHLEVGGECSVCGWQFQWFENAEAHYCPHCGAKMDGGRKDGK